MIGTVYRQGLIYTTLTFNSVTFNLQSVPYQLKQVKEKGTYFIQIQESQAFRDPFVIALIVLASSSIFQNINLHEWSRNATCIVVRSALHALHCTNRARARARSRLQDEERFDISIVSSFISFRIRFEFTKSPPRLIPWKKIIVGSDFDGITNASDFAEPE